MEKISRILPESPRLKAEKETLRPVRPGAPAFGRAEGSTEIRDRVNISSVKNIGPQEFMQPSYKNLKEAQHAKMVEDMSRKFFAKPPKENPTSGTPDLDLTPLTVPEPQTSSVTPFDDEA